MLRGISAPTDFGSIDRAPYLSADEKLATINQAPVSACKRLNYHWLFLPYVEGLVYGLVSVDGIRAIHIDRLNIGDKQLYGHGIGSRLVRAAIRHSLELDSTVTQVSGTWPRLGAVNTFISVLGAKNVTIEQYGNRYGAGTSKPLEAVFDDEPFQPGQPYKIQGVQGIIDPVKARTWELPEPVIS
jgi:hypothetical protein